MPTELITNRNMTEGLHIPFIYINDITGGLFMNLLLLSFYLIVTMGLYYSLSRETGKGDFPQATAVGGFATSVLTILFLVTLPGLVNVITATVVFFVTTVSVVWLFASSD